MNPTPATSELRDAMLSLRQFFTRAVLFSVFTNLLSLAPTFYMLEVYSRVVYSRNGETLLMLTVLIVVVYAVMEFSDWVRNLVMHAASQRLDRKLGERVFNAMFEARLRSMSVGATPLTDLKTLRGFLASPASLAIIDAPISLLFIGIIFAMSVPLGALVLIAAAAMLAVGYRTERTTMPAIVEAQKFSTEATRYASSTLKNAQVIEAMGMMDHIRKRWLDKQRKFLGKQAVASDHAGEGAAMSKFIQIAQSSFVLGAGCYLRLIGELDANGSAMIVCWILSSRALSPLQHLITQWKSVDNAREVYARLDKLLGALPVRAATMELPPPKGALAVEHVVAMVPGTQTPILRGVNFSIAAGESLAIVGPSASGKTTLARLLVGLWPTTAGKVRLDGVDVNAWNKQELGPHIGYLPQESELFAGTVAENIARFGEVDLAKVEEAARTVGLHEMVEALPEGYETLLGAGGSILSGGQRQRVALARTLYNDPQFIVLDEPNSSLDEAGERALLQTLATLKSRGVTIVIVTHRTDVLSIIDRMVVLRDGQMQLFGPRDDVLATLMGKPRPAPAPAPALAAT